MTGRTEPHLSSQNVAGFSNISDFPSNSYRQKLYRQIRNVLTTSLAIAEFVCTGRYRALYAAPSTAITWSSRSRSRCKYVIPIHWNPWVNIISIDVQGHAVFLTSTFQHLIKNFVLVFPSANAGSHLEKINFRIHFPDHFSKKNLVCNSTCTVQLLTVFMWLYIGRTLMSLCLYTKLLLFRHKGAEGREGMDPLIPKIATVKKWVVRFRPWSIWAKGKWPRHKINKSLRGSSAGLDDKVKVN
jgi:hypothetical protein